MLNSSKNSTRMLQKIHWQLEDYAYFRKCGEITVSPDEENFGFNCTFCPAICLQFEVFMQHLNEQHSADIKQRYLYSEDHIDCGTQTDLILMDVLDTDINMDIDMNMELAADMNIVSMPIASHHHQQHTNNYKQNLKKHTNWNEFQMSAASPIHAHTTTPHTHTNTKTLATGRAATPTAPHTATSTAENEFPNIIELPTNTRVANLDTDLCLNIYEQDINCQNVVLETQQQQQQKSTQTTALEYDYIMTENAQMLTPVQEFYCYDETKSNNFEGNLVATTTTTTEISDNGIIQFSMNDVVLDTQQQITHNHKNVTLSTTTKATPTLLKLPNDAYVNIDVNSAAINDSIVEKQVPLLWTTALDSSDIAAAAELVPGLILEQQTTEQQQQNDHMSVEHVQEVNERKLQNITPPTPPATPEESVMLPPTATATVPLTTTTTSLSVTPAATTTTITTRSMCNSEATTQNSKPLKKREIERNKEIVGYLLDIYERNEKFWNPKHPEYKYNAKSSIYNELSAPLARDLNVSVSGDEIFAVLKELRGRYRRELTKVNTLGEKYKTRFWCFEKMHFLRGIIENKRAEREAKSYTESTESEKSFETDSEPTRSSTNREALSYILNAFKLHECLWNPQHYDYVNCNKKELYREISAQLYEEMQVTMSGEECFKEIQKLRTRYRKELRIMIKHKGLYIPKLWCFDEMEFLHKIFEDQIFSRISKKKGIVATASKSKFINADCIEFKNTDEQLQFVEIYRNYPALWDVDHPDYRSTAYRNRAIAQMLEELNNTFNTKSTTEQLEKTLFQLRKDFSAEKQKLLTNENVISTSLIHARLTEFLEQNVGPFRCDICQEIIKTSDQFKVHHSAHDGTQPFICTLCGKGFQMPCNLTVHIRRHRRDFPYACEKCDKRFATSTEVVIHMRTHTGERPYICDLCGKSFKTWSFFDIHRRTHLNQSTFHCPICDKGFYEKNRFTDHMNGHLNIRKHLCKVCGKTFTTLGNLKKHMELHLTIRKYKCGLCSKRFAQFASLRWHKKKEHNTQSNEQ